MSLILSIPRTFPSELVIMILGFSVSGKKKLDVGYFSEKQMDQICEGIQRRKFLTLINTLTVTLMNAVLCNKMELGGFSVESQMECFIKDVKAFLELSDRSTQEKDFTRFSKIELPTKVILTNFIIRVLPRSNYKAIKYFRDGS